MNPLPRNCKFWKICEVVALFLIVYTLVFFAVIVLPVDPVRDMLGPSASEAAVSELRDKLGMNRPILVRYFVTLGGFITGDLGDSVYYRQPVVEIVWSSMPATLARFFAALSLGTVAGAALSLLMVSDRSLRKLTFLFQLSFSIPAFVLMIVALVVASSVFGVAPSGQRMLYEAIGIAACALYSFGAVGAFLSERLRPGQELARRRDLLLMLRAPKMEVTLILLREAIPGMLAVVANSATAVMTAVTFSEYVFGLPGFAVVFIKSVERGDLFVVAFGSGVLAVLFIMIQFLADFLTRTIDARARM